MKDQIIDSADSPRALETLYRANPKEFTRAFRDAFAERSDSIRIERAGTRELLNEFIIPHKPTREVNFLLRDERSRAEIDKVARTAGQARRPTPKAPAAPEGYERLFADRFDSGLGKWGSGRSRTCGFLRLARFRQSSQHVPPRSGLQSQGPGAMRGPQR